jgi:hypothetical protein
MATQPEDQNPAPNGSGHLVRFFDAVTSLSFWRRLFRWGTVRALSYDAFNEYRALRDAAARRQQEVEASISRIGLLTSEVDHLKESLAAAGRDLALLREREIRREETTSSALDTLNTIRQQISSERAAERQAQEAQEQQQRERVKRTWQEHEQTVRERIKQLCQRHTIEFVDVVPFRGSPDNTILIAGEYVVFDAKSPAGDDLRAFGAYLKTQAEAARKYVKEDHVRREVFLVIPSSTLPHVQEYVHRFAEHTVFIVPVEALEPIILALRRIQEYAFAEQLGPETRESLVRIVGRFMHMTKRRIQVDQFFDRQFLQALAMAETDLEKDMLVEVQEFERTLKLNPPPDQRLKLLSRDDLSGDEDRLARESEARGIPRVDPGRGEALPPKGGEKG